MTSSLGRSKGEWGNTAYATVCPSRRALSYVIVLSPSLVGPRLRALTVPTPFPTDNFSAQLKRTESTAGRRALHRVREGWYRQMMLQPLSAALPLWSEMFNSRDCTWFGVSPWGRTPSRAVQEPQIAAACSRCMARKAGANLGINRKWTEQTGHDHAKLQLAQAIVLIMLCSFAEVQTPWYSWWESAAGKKKGLGIAARLLCRHSRWQPLRQRWQPESLLKLVWIMFANRWTYFFLPCQLMNWWFMNIFLLCDWFCGPLRIIHKKKTWQKIRNAKAFLAANVVFWFFSHAASSVFVAVKSSASAVQNWSWWQISCSFRAGGERGLVYDTGLSQGLPSWSRSLVWASTTHSW